MGSYYFWVDSSTIGGFIIAGVTLTLIIAFLIWTRGRDN